MREPALRTLAVLFLSACASRAPVAAPAAGAPTGAAAAAGVSAEASGRPPAEVVLAAGGELGLIDRPLSANPAMVAVSSSVEVPGDSRLQAALAMVDATTRAELCKTVAVAIVSLETDQQVDGAAPEVMSYTAEATRVLLPALPLPSHAWRKVQREGEVVLVLYGRLEVPVEQLAAAVSKLLTARGKPAGRAAGVVERLAAPGQP
jgi:hypothetical protein